MRYHPKVGGLTVAMLFAALAGCGGDEAVQAPVAISGQSALMPPPKPSPTTAPTTAQKPLPTSPRGKKYDFTNGTAGSTIYQVGAVTTRADHGNRIYCVISHFSYDDPIIFPREPGKAHLHMFWGNTAVDAFTTSNSILGEGSSSCEGGANYKVGAWIPALFNSGGEVVIPEQTYIYYKTFGPPNMNYARIQVIPQGLAMLASSTTRNFTSDQIRVEYLQHNGYNALLLNISYPSCVATHNGQMTGNPILSFRDMPGNLATQVNSHVAYPAGAGSGNEVGCPTSHPYRFATPQFLIYFDVNRTGSAPYLSSDAMANAPRLSTLHGDYMFGADPSANEAIRRCVHESRRCGFDAGGRGQLPDRFVGPVGQLYQDSTVLLNGTDRTPFGNALPPMRSSGAGMPSSGAAMPSAWLPSSGAAMPSSGTDGHHGHGSH